MAAVRPLRTRLLRERGKCDICGHSPAHPWPNKPRECSALCLHEILNGPGRDKALDKPYALLCLCWACNSESVEDKAVWPQARQLAVLKRVAPQYYDLKAFNWLSNPNAPNRITAEEVETWRLSETSKYPPGTSL
jgi:hypothetical protein